MDAIFDSKEDETMKLIEQLQTSVKKHFFRRS